MCDTLLVVEIVDLTLDAPKEATTTLREFYLDRLGFDEVGAANEAALSFHAGVAISRFCDTPGYAPFYHFAFLVPGNRFGAAYEWLRARSDLLPDPKTLDTVFDFNDWDALACYCLDPAGNILELIAHRGIADSSAEGPFEAAEVVGLSEVGLVVDDKTRAASEIERLGLRVWDGEIADPARLVFVGERSRTLILVPPGRGWLPTGRPAEIHPVRIVLNGPRAGHVHLRPHRLTAIR
ncbi:MAG: hypothetical protein M3360_03335 [Actinomycetota bacterium]|nr:hypothetical protein [Actinomycetota bacterium]